MTPRPFTPSPGLRRGLLALAFFVSALLASAGEGKTAATFNVPAGDAAATLRQFAEQSGQAVVYMVDAVRGVPTNAVKGSLTPHEALEQMLAGSKLQAVADEKTGALSVTNNGKNAPRLAQTDSDQPGQSKIKDGVIVLDTFEVLGTKLLNMDIRRSRDDAQPYVIFDRTTIEQAGVDNVEDFLKQRLPQNTVGTTFNQRGGGGVSSGNISQINLRGLGINQTLILIDGHRAASVVNSGLTSADQADINGIPLSAIERIEILPTTASGIYGGGATGGVVNIILRRDYAGAELKVAYGNTLHSDTGSRRVDLAAGFSLEGGRTRVMIAGSYSDQNTLVTQDRPFFLRGIARVVANNPASIFGAFLPPSGARTNYATFGSPLNGPGTPTFGVVPVGATGNAGLAGLQPGIGQYDLALADNSQPAAGARFALLNSPTVESLNVTIRRQMVKGVEAFVELAAANNTGLFRQSLLTPLVVVPAGAPSNPFGQDLFASVPATGGESLQRSDSRTRRLVAGVVAELPGRWKAEGDFTYHESTRTLSPQVTVNSAAFGNAVDNGTVNVLRDLNKFPIDFSPYLLPSQSISAARSTLSDTTIRASGPVWALPGGESTLAASLEYRDERIPESTRITQANNSFPNGLTQINPSRSQQIESAYAEARIPLFSGKNRRTGLELLELQLAGRYDRYTVNGVTPFVNAGATTPIRRAANRNAEANPTIGLRYSPVADLTLRASYGTGFLPPSVAQVLPNVVQPSFLRTPDPKRGNSTIGTIDFLSGGNPNLIPEHSKSWSAGAIYAPRALSGLRVSLDYTRIDKSDNIGNLSPDDLFANETAFSGRIVRAPLTPGDPFTVGRVTFVDFSLINLTRAVIEAYDLQLDYSRKTESLGEFDFFFLAARQTHFQTQALASSPLVENVGISNGNPLKFKANVGLTWRYGRWSAGWTSRYFDSYLVSTNASLRLSQGGSAFVPSQIYHDVFVRYRFGVAGIRSRVASRYLDNLEVQVGVENVFNTEPPVDVSNQQSYYSPFGDLLGTRYRVSLKKNF